MEVYVLAGFLVWTLGMDRELSFMIGYIFLMGFVVFVEVIIREGEGEFKVEGVLR